jgi:glycosidase
MAQDTPADLRNLVMYSVFVRQHSPEGTFAALEADLPRIRALGVDLVWLLPIHPIGAVNRKGTLGSPYSIRDYRGVNPEYGTLDDVARLVRTAHGLGLKVMLDVVYNHTAHDSRLVAEHPEFFHQDDAGRPVTTVPDWSDVIDLRHGHPGLTEELIATLEDWARLGVDGFRCDVASLVPAAFWREARARLARVKPGVIWLAENVHALWVAERREAGLPACSDAELFDAGFDLEYDYDIWSLWQRVVRGEVPVRRYLEMLRFQDCIYPATFVKMRCVENHDQPRIMELAASPAQARAWTAFAAFNRGAFLIYAGQEAAADHRPSLFEADKVAWNGYPLSPFITRLAALKREPAVHDGRFVLAGDEPAIVAAWVAASGDETLVGVFNVGAAAAGVAVPIQVPDGTYEDLLSDRPVTVTGGAIAMPAVAAILRVPGEHPPAPLDFELLT